jgi:hypothetical protein
MVTKKIKQPEPKVKIVDTSKKPPKIAQAVVQKAMKARKVVNPLDMMTLSELKAKRIEIAETVNGGPMWEKTEDGTYISALDKTDYWKIKEKIDQWTK